MLLALQAPAQASRWQVLPDSRMQVLGQTNVGRYRCDVEDYPGRDTLHIRQQGGVWTIERGAVRVPARSFNCHNPFMTADFRRTIQADRHPTVQIGLQQVLVRNGQAQAQMVVQLAGEAEGIHPPVEFRQSGTEIWIRGSHPFTFAQFGLTPPRRLMGAVVVRDSLTVQFDLHLRRLD